MGCVRQCNLARQKEEDRDFIVSMQPQNSAGNWLQGCCEKRRIVSKSCAGNATCRKSHQNNWVLTWIFMCYSFIGYTTLLLRVHSLTFLFSIPRLISSLFASKYLMKWVNVWSAPSIKFNCINWSEETQPIVAHWIVDVMEWSTPEYYTDVCSFGSPRNCFTGFQSESMKWKLSSTVLTFPVMGRSKRSIVSLIKDGQVLRRYWRRGRTYDFTVLTFKGRHQILKWLTNKMIHLLKVGLHYRTPEPPFWHRMLNYCSRWEFLL